MDRRAQLAHIRTTAEMMGVTLDELADLALAASVDGDVPTVAEFHQRVTAVLSIRRGWDKNRWLFDALVEELGDKAVDAVKPRDIEIWSVKRRDRVKGAEEDRQRRMQEQGTPGAPRRTGKGAQRSAIESARAFFSVAVDDGLIRDNPARKVRRPAPTQPKARAISMEQVQDLFAFAAAGPDPHLEAVLFWFVLETGARRGGVMGLRVRDLRHDSREVALYEKGDLERLQPCSSALLNACAELAASRGATAPGDHVFQYFGYNRGAPRPLTKKYFERLLKRLRQQLPWAREVWLRLHDLRHTAITNIERISGSTAVARLFAGHADRQTTDVYDRADARELRAAVDAWAGHLQT